MEFLNKFRQILNHINIQYIYGCKDKNDNILCIYIYPQNYICSWKLIIDQKLCNSDLIEQFFIENGKKEDKNYFKIKNKIFMLTFFSLLGKKQILKYQMKYSSNKNILCFNFLGICRAPPKKIIYAL